jgi:hypothetical protein
MSGRRFASRIFTARDIEVGHFFGRHRHDEPPTREEQP